MTIQHTRDDNKQMWEYLTIPSKKQKNETIS